MTQKLLQKRKSQATKKTNIQLWQMPMVVQ